MCYFLLANASEYFDREYCDLEGGACVACPAFGSTSYDDDDAEVGVIKKMNTIKQYL